MKGKEEDNLKVLPPKPKTGNGKKNKIKEHMPGPQPFLWAINGPCRSGKTIMLLNILYNRKFHYDYFKYIYYISPTVLIDESLEPVADDEDITKIWELDDLDGVIELILEEQKEKEKKDREPILILIDDCIDKLKSKVLSSLCSRYRHYNISLIICSQYYKSFSPIIRANADYWCIYKNNLQKEVEKITEDFNMFNKDFERYYREATSKKYNFLYINQKTRQLWQNFDVLLFNDE